MEFDEKPDILIFDEDDYENKELELLNINLGDLKVNMELYKMLLHKFYAAIRH